MHHLFNFTVIGDSYYNHPFCELENGLREVKELAQDNTDHQWQNCGPQLVYLLAQSQTS